MLHRSLLLNCTFKVPGATYDDERLARWTRTNWRYQKLSMQPKYTNSREISSFRFSQYSLHYSHNPPFTQSAFQPVIPPREITWRNFELSSLLNQAVVSDIVRMRQDGSMIESEGERGRRLTSDNSSSDSRSILSVISLDSPTTSTTSASHIARDEYNEREKRTETHFPFSPKISTKPSPILSGNFGYFYPVRTQSVSPTPPFTGRKGRTL